MRYLILLLAMLLMGCGTEKPEHPDNFTTFIQTCEECGEKWEVLSKSPVPPTVEWCFYDGNYCQEGIKIMAEVIRNEIPEVEKKLEIKFIEHCKTCKGCKFATFTPKSWKEAIDSNSNEWGKRRRNRQHHGY